MAVYLVTYDLSRETVRPKIVDEVKQTDWARLSESSYAILTTETVDQAYERFQKHTDNNDHIYIITLKKPWNGFGPKEVNDWLERNLPY